MAKTFDWASAEDTRDIVHILVQALVEDHLVVMPVETAYHVFASGLSSKAVSKLSALGEQRTVDTPSVFLRSPQESLDYSPRMSRVAARAVTRGWPGPLVLELPVDDPASLAKKLPESVQSRLVRDGKFLPQRVAAQDTITQAMRLMPGPLIGAPLVDDSGQPIFDAKIARQRAAEAVSLIVTNGLTEHQGFATSLRIDDERCTLIRQGIVEASMLDSFVQLMVLLVCTGNTCRSPMAECLLRNLLAQKFPERLDAQRPVVQIASAGLSAFPGGPASVEAQVVMDKRQLSLGDHQSKAVSERALRYADFVLTMTNSHRQAILERTPEFEPKISLLSGDGRDVSDPFGGTEAVYAACADQIEGYLRQWVSKMDESWFPKWQAN